MRVKWEYLGKQYVISGHRNGKMFLNHFPCDECADILAGIEGSDESIVSEAKSRAKAICDSISDKHYHGDMYHSYKLNEHIKENRKKFKVPQKKRSSDGIGISEVVFLGEKEMQHINWHLSMYESKKWTYEGKQYMMHYDQYNNRTFLNGNQVMNCEDIWYNVDMEDETVSWRAKHKAKEIEIARLEASGIKIDRLETPEYQPTFKESVVTILQAGIVLVGLIGVLYLIYKIWWFFIGDWTINGPFKSEYSGFDITAESIMYFIAFIVIIEEVVRRIRNGHF